MKQALLLVVILALAGCAGKGGNPPTQTTFFPAPALEPLDELTWSGTDCAELALLVERPASTVRPFVHPNFTLVEAQGMATVAVGFARCTSGTVFGNTTNNLVMSDVGVYVDDPEGGPAPVFYQFWHASNRAATYENMSRVGLPTQAAPNSNFLTFGLVQATLAESRIASVDGDYYGTGTTVPASATIPARSFRWYHASDNGTMYTDFDLAFKSAGAARGNISIDAASPLSKIMGGTNVDGQGLYWTFDLTTIARRV